MPGHPGASRHGEDLYRLTGHHVAARFREEDRRRVQQPQGRDESSHRLRRRRQETHGQFHGMKVGGDAEDPLFVCHPGVQYVQDTGQAHQAYTGGVIGGTAWLFTRPEWEGALDFLFIDEAGQVALANAIAMARCAKNLVLLGDQMQLEQPVQGSHPGDAGLSALQYALKDMDASLPDAPVFHAVVPSDYGLFLGESRRMHPSVCRFISESMYEGRLAHIPTVPGRESLSRLLPTASSPMRAGSFSAAWSTMATFSRVTRRLSGSRRSTMNCADVSTRPKMASQDRWHWRIFCSSPPITPKSARFRAALPPGARVGSVDKFQGQEAPVCILSLCSSYGEYGSRGLAFILDRNRVNVAISRAQCLAVVVADPRIAGTLPGSLDEMKLINLFCKLTDDHCHP